MSLGKTALPLALGLVLSCGGDSPGPAGPGTSSSQSPVSITVKSVAPPVIEANTVRDGVTVSCHVELSATNSAPGATTWLSGTLRLFTGADRTTPIGTDSIPQAVARSAWGGVLLPAGQPQTSGWTVISEIPFVAEMEFTYKPDGLQVIRSSKVSFDCLPSPLANAPAPVISALTTFPPTQVINAGSPIVVNYSASAAAALFQSFVTISGPCTFTRLFGENLQPSTSRSVTISFPDTCTLGTPISVTLETVDGRGARATRTLATTTSIGDNERPQLSVEYLLPQGFTANPDADLYGPTDLRMYVRASDNHKVAAVVWEVLPYGVRDSVVATTGKTFEGLVSIPIGAEWSDPMQVKVEARDAAGLLSPARITAQGALRPHSTAAIPVRAGAIAGEARQFAIDEQRGLIYVAQGYDKRIAVVSATTLGVVETITVPSVPLDVDITYGGDTLLVAMSGKSLGIVDLRTSPRRLTAIPLNFVDSAGGQRIVRVAALANNHAFVATEGSTPQQFALLDVTLPSGVQRERAEVRIGGSALYVAMGRSQDHSVVYLNQAEGFTSCLRRYEVTSDSFSACVTPRVNGVPSVSRDGSRVAVLTDVYNASLARVSTATVTSGFPTALSPDGMVLYQPAGVDNGLLRTSAATGQVLSRVAIPHFPDVPAHVSPNGKTLVFMKGMGLTTTQVVVLDLP